MFNKQEIEIIKELLIRETTRLSEVKVVLTGSLVEDMSNQYIKNVINIIESIRVKLEEMRNENKK